jgi:hypothetical protein
MFSLGSIHSNTWTGQAADLAAREFLAVHPTYRWWNRRPNLKGYEKDCKYSLIASITTPTTDIYTPVAVRRSWSRFSFTTNTPELKFSAHTQVPTARKF